MELIEMLTSQLGVTAEQAKGGSGLIFKMAKDKLDEEEFGKVAGVVPDMEGIISSAPKAGVIEGLTSLLGGKAGHLAGLASGFKHLDLGGDMVGKFVPIILSFVQSKGGDEVKDILEKIMK
ncbi:DUF2780 domain-containing protein [uncultured Ilyobacter sp.]|uniref:DUF2780 domain-containing protein n=1 Tax=uncultured Ilyobacter sp. TaxID=544433 RepID=UPI0029C83EE6|nr:DUF2780 domain-containing protein [uncultured Ilyobacter sp.]